MKIYKATEKDITDLVFLNSFVQKIHAEQYPKVFKLSPDEREISNFFKKVIEKEKNLILVAHLNKITVGYLWVTFQTRQESPFKYENKLAYIHQVVVHKDYRNQGIGKELFTYLESVAEGKKTNNYVLNSWAFNKEAHEFFEKLGFSTCNINLWKRKPTT